MRYQHADRQYAGLEQFISERRKQMTAGAGAGAPFALLAYRESATTFQMITVTASAVTGPTPALYGKSMMYPAAHPQVMTSKKRQSFPCSSANDPMSLRQVLQQASSRSRTDLCPD
ncbi:MAG: hypothetical protein ACLT76_06515 [Clostridium fessum]